MSDFSGLRQRLALPVIALAACIGYYIASLVGLQLRLPPSTPSVVWPPNAVLTSALLLTSTADWWLVLVAALPAHLYLQLGTGWSLPFALGLFVTNCLEALLAAGGTYLLSDAPGRFDTLRRLTAFMVSAVAAVALTSFADAAVVAGLHGEPYWLVWRARSLSNLLAAFTVVPAVVGVVHESRRWWPRPRSVVRAAEASVLGLSVFAIAWVDFSESFTDVPALRAVTSQTPLAIQLPFLLWAAVRFGPAGTGLILLTTSLSNAWAAVQGHGPFTSISPATTITALTLSQIVVATTLLYLATLIEERRLTQHELKRRLQFEELLSRLSAALVEQPSDRMHRALETWLGPIRRVLDMGDLALFAADEGPDGLHPLYSCSRQGSSHADAPHGHVRWARACFAAKETVVMDVERGVAIPLIAQEQVLGAITFGFAREHQLADDLMANARLVAEVLASALGRERAENALRHSELMQSAILKSLASGVAVIDRSGRLLQVNDRWALLAGECQWMDVPIGSNLIDRCLALCAAGEQLAGAIVDGVAAVLDGSRAQFSVEHSTDTNGGAEWWSVSAVPLNRVGGGAVITRSDITELRRAEMEAQRSRQALAHVSRVATAGEMTASLAHQLNQPLAAITINARTAQRLLESLGARQDRQRSLRRSTFVELRAILCDIVADVKRAGDVIVRLRKLLRKGELEMTSFDLAAGIQEVVELVGGEATLRNVAISFEPVRTPIIARGDRVQLQQVILNLLQNAIEAMTDQRDRARTIVIRCRHLEEDERRVCVSVQDSGPGLPAGAEETVFEPFYTTKVGGMGMGLSIVRSIVEAHGGSIRAVCNTASGALFEFRLPVEGPRAA